MEEIRYSRLEALPGIGKDGINRLKTGSILVIGCGALGSLCAMYLAASGVGKIGIADFDTIDISNLQRQLFFKESELGMSKCETLASRIRDINLDVEIIPFPILITRQKGKEIFPEYDFIIDGSDNPDTKLMTSKICEELSIPYCIGGVREYCGQAMSWLPGHCGYSEIFGETYGCSGFTPCSIGGVLGPAAGMVASVQAAEAIKFLSGAGKLLTDKLFTFDLSIPTVNIF